MSSRKVRSRISKHTYCSTKRQCIIIIDAASPDSFKTQSVASGFTFVDQNLDELTNREEKLELKVRSDGTGGTLIYREDAPCFISSSHLHSRRPSPYTCRFSSENFVSTARRSTCEPASPVRNEILILSVLQARSSRGSISLLQPAHIQKHFLSRLADEADCETFKTCRPQDGEDCLQLVPGIPVPE